MCHWLGMLRPALVAHTDALGDGNAVRTNRSEVVIWDVARVACAQVAPMYLRKKAFSFSMSDVCPQIAATPMPLRAICINKFTQV